MLNARSPGKACKFFGIGGLSRPTLLSLLLVFLSVAPASAQTKSVKIMLDWIIQGTHAPFFVAQDRDYFKAAGVTVDAIDAERARLSVARWATV